MKTIRFIALILASVLLLAGCNADSSSVASSDVSGDSSAVVSDASESASESVSSGESQTNNNSSTGASQGTNSKTTSVDAGASIEVTTALRTKYFDYFVQNSTEMLPRASFDSVSDMTDDSIIYYALRNVKPTTINEYEDMESMFNYSGKEIKAAILKYFNVSDVDFANSSYTYNGESDTIYLTRQTVTLAYRFAMLTSLSKNSSGVYTAKFTVYNKMVGSSEDAATVTAEYRKSLITGSTKYSVYGYCTMSFKEITEGTGFYIQFISSNTEVSE